MQKIELRASSTTTKETIERMSIACKGRIPWNKGKPELYISGEYLKVGLLCLIVEEKRNRQHYKRS